MRFPFSGSSMATRARRGALPTGVAGIACLLSPVAANAQIVVGAGVGGVSLGQSQAAVHNRLGLPHKLYCWSGTGSSCRWQEADYVQSARRGSPVEQILFSKAGRVIDLLTGRGNQHTPAGIGVGSSQKALRRAYPKVACSSEECVLVKSHGDSAVATTFFFTGSRVTAIEVSRADFIRLTLSPASVKLGAPTTATITLTDPAGDPEIGAIPELTVSAGSGDQIGSITPLGGVGSGRYSVQVLASSHQGPVTITATFHWGPPALRRVLGISASSVLKQL